MEKKRNETKRKKGEKTNLLFVIKSSISLFYSCLVINVRKYDSHAHDGK